MDKVLKVRYPGDAPLRDTSPEAPPDRVVQALTVPPKDEVVSTIATDDGEDMRTGFIDLDAGTQGDSLAENMIAAVVDGAQTLVSGEGVAMRTTEDAVIGAVRVPKGTALAGKATLSGERLLISINSVRIGSQVVPVALEVVDMDGMTGVRVKGSINRDISKESADEAVGSLGVTSVDPGVAGQATAAGIHAAKSLLSRKIRLVRVGLPAGYRVLLRNTKIKR
jgi:conjugative transposon TraM protein